MMNQRFSLKNYIDWIAIGIGCIAMVLMFLCPNTNISKAAIFLTGTIGLLYLGYASYLWFIKRVDFDWHLINGHFLRKVIIVVISMPFTITMFIIFMAESKELVFDNNLYRQIIEQQTEKIGTEGNICVNDSIFITGFSSHHTEELDKTLPDSLRKQQEDPSVFWTVYYHFIDPGNQHMTTTEKGRTFAAIIAIFGVFLLNGLLVSSIIGWVDRRKEKWQNGEIDRYRPWYLGKNKFAVVIGANEIAASVIKNLLTPQKKGEINYKCEGRNDYVIIQTSRKPEDVRVELSSHLEEMDLKKVIIYKALRDSIRELKNLHIEHATEIYILGESTLVDGGESFHDAMNMRCLNHIAHLLENAPSKNKKNNNGKSAKKVCKVMFEYQTTSSIFQFSDVSDNIKKNIIFIPFNRYDSWARAVIADNSAIEDCSGSNSETIKYMPLDGVSGLSENSDRHVHFVIVGMSKMGIAMGVQAMLQTHYLNFAKAEMENDPNKREGLMNERRTRITFIDTNADKEMAFFKSRYENLFALTRNRYIDVNKCKEEDLHADSSYNWQDPMKESCGKWNHLCENGQNFIDLEIEFVKGELESDGMRKYLSKISDKENPWVLNSNLTIAICLTQTHQAVAASLYMPISVYEKAQEIWVYQRESADIVLNMTKSNQQDKRYKNLKPFGMLYSEYMSDRSQYLRSLLVNGAYDLNGKIDGKDIKADDRDMSRKETYTDLRSMWKKLSIDKKFSNRYFADSIPLKVRSINATDLSPEDLEIEIRKHSDVLARSEHNRWIIQQLMLGYFPCDSVVDSEFIKLNANYKDSYYRLKKWRKSVGWNSLSEEDQKKLRSTDKICIELERKNDEAKNKFKDKKEFYKVGEYRLHPNICAFNHLDNVDFEAKDYDIYLNSIIPTIKKLVDDKIKATS